MNQLSIYGKTVILKGIYLSLLLYFRQQFNKIKIGQKVIIWWQIFDNTTCSLLINSVIFQVHISNSYIWTLVSHNQKIQQVSNTSPSHAVVLLCTQEFLFYFQDDILQNQERNKKKDGYYFHWGNKSIQIYKQNLHSFS